VRRQRLLPRLLKLLPLLRQKLLPRPQLKLLRLQLKRPLRQPMLRLLLPLPPRLQPLVQWFWRSRIKLAQPFRATQ
jgi:hypothetical protein